MAQSNNTTKEDASFNIRRQRRVSSIAAAKAFWVLLSRGPFGANSFQQLLAYAFELPMRRLDIK